MEYLYNGQWFEVQIKAVDTIPVGAIIEYPSLTAPYGYLLCDGRAVSRTEYADLFAVYGTQFGAGDGSTTFNLPDYSGRTGVGIDENDTDFNAIGKTGGEKTHTLTIDEMPSHVHNTYSAGGSTGYPYRIPQTEGTNSDQNSFCATMPNGGGQAHNNIQPSIVSAYYVKYEQSVGVVANVHNESNSSEQDVYSCKYINDINTYSTDEVFTGKFWIDGKPIYRKVLQVGAISGTDVNGVAVPNNVDTMLPNLCGMLYDNNGNGYPLNYNNVYNVQQDIGAFYYKTSSAKRISLKQYAEFGITSGYIIVEYTKTTD